ncbi:hypothetical protein WL97_23545 [Burkholderia ubonensis]|nr:hypothetical protein WL38_23050 [Burkholderia ubonensis]KWH07016.1 hypothetical protein WL97_23545 [Burkholderia ubonensis]
MLWEDLLEFGQKATFVRDYARSLGDQLRPINSRSKLLLPNETLGRQYDDPLNPQSSRNNRDHLVCESRESEQRDT